MKVDLEAETAKTTSSIEQYLDKANITEVNINTDSETIETTIVLK